MKRRRSALYLLIACTFLPLSGCNSGPTVVTEWFGRSSTFDMTNRGCTADSQTTRQLTLTGRYAAVSMPVTSTDGSSYNDCMRAAGYVPKAEHDEAIANRVVLPTLAAPAETQDKVYIVGGWRVLFPSGPGWPEAFIWREGMDYAVWFSSASSGYWFVHRDGLDKSFSPKGVIRSSTFAYRPWEKPPSDHQTVTEPMVVTLRFNNQVWEFRMTPLGVTVRNPGGSLYGSGQWSFPGNGNTARYISPTGEEIES